MKNVQKANKNEDVCVSIGTSGRTCEVMARLSNVDIFQKLIPNYVGLKKIPKMLKMLKAEEAKMEKSEMLITWKDGSVYHVVDNNGKPELREYLGVTYTELENQIRLVIDGQVDSDDIEEFVTCYMSEIAERTVFYDQISCFISMMGAILEEDATSGDFYDSIKQSFNAIKVSKSSRKQIIKFLQTVEEELKKSVDAQLTNSFLKNLEEALQKITFTKTEKAQVEESLKNIHQINNMNREFSENCMVIEGSDSDIYQKLLTDPEIKYVREQKRFRSSPRVLSCRDDEEIRYINKFLYDLEMAVKNGIKSFKVCKNYPAKIDGSIHFNNGRCAVGYSAESWNEMLETNGYRLGSKDELVLLLATRIIEKGYYCSYILSIINADNTCGSARELILGDHHMAKLSYYSIYTTCSGDYIEDATAFIVHDIVNK